VSLHTEIITTVEAGTIIEGLKVKILERGDGEREQVIFHLHSADEKFGIMGTYDQLSDFGAAVMSAMLSWCLVNQRSDWFGDDLSILQEGIRAVDRRNGSGSGTGDARGRRSGERNGLASGSPEAE